MGMGQYLTAVARHDGGPSRVIVTLQQLRKAYDLDDGVIELAEVLDVEHHTEEGAEFSCWRSITFAASDLVYALDEVHEPLKRGDDSTTSARAAARHLYMILGFVDQVHQCECAGWLVEYSINR